MTHRCLIVTTLCLWSFLAGTVASASASDLDYTMQVDVNLTSRLSEDGATAWIALPKGKVTVFAGGKQRRVYARGFSACCYPAGKTISTLHDQMALVERPLTPRERRRNGARLAWIDGDVIIAHPSNPACPTGLGLAETRAALRGTTQPFERLYAPRSAFNGIRELLFGLTAAREDTRVYGDNVRLVGEASAISAVASDSRSAAAVAWSAAREEIASGAVCALPINGRTADEKSLRDRSYPAAIHVYLVYRKKVYAGWQSYVKRWYTNFVASVGVRSMLRKERGRDVLAP